MDQLLQRREVSYPFAHSGRRKDSPELSRVPGETDSLRLESTVDQGESMFQEFSVQSGLPW